MTSSDQLRSKAQKLLAQAKAAEGSSESLVHLLHSLECDTQADALEEGSNGVPEPHVIEQQTGGGERESA